MIKVLIVDDDFGVRDTLKDFLEFFYDDIVVELAKNGTEGIEKVNGDGYQILISDQMMPDMKGSEFISKVIEKLRTNKTWIYIYSGQLMDELSVKLKEYEDVQIIDKFTNPMFFKEIVEKYRLAHPQ